MDEKKKKLKIRLVISGLVVIIFGGLWWWQNYAPYDITNGWNDVRSDDDLLLQR